LLFTEMITTGALLHGPAERLLAYHPAEQPLAIQLGGADPHALARAAKLAQHHGFAEINLNVGCPSPRVKRGRFGACLMREPDLVADLISAIRGAVTTPVSVKCRLGVDDDDSQTLLEAFVDTVAGGGCSKFYIHARKALLNGLSPAQNRVIPPLDYPRVYQLKAAFPDLTIILNGGINDSESAIEHLAHVDGIMVGRQAYHNPLIMNELSQRLCAEQSIGAFDVMRGYLDYMESELLAGTRLQDMTRHCLGLFSGMPGARHYRRLMSDSKRLRSNDLRVVEEALDCVQVSSIAA
jgi:tRNA-dihydrouridine synthase A